MNRSNLWRFLFLLSSCIGAKWYCAPPPFDLTKMSYYFFDPVRFNHNIFDKDKLRPLDTIVERIRTVVPSKWRGLACEGVYYRLPNYTPDSVYFRYLDLCQAAFPEDSVRAFVQLERGGLFIGQTRYDTAMVCLQDCYHISTKDGRTKRASDAKTGMGIVALRRTNYPEATRQFLDAYDIIVSLGKYDDGRLFEILMKLGKAYRGGNDYATAQVWHQKAWAYAFTDSHMEGFKILSADAVAENYLKFNQLDSAQTMIDTAFYFQRLYKNDYEEANRYCILAEIQRARGDCSAALSNFKKAISRNQQMDKPLIISRYDKGLAAAYACLGKIDDAIVFYKKALNTTDTISQSLIYGQLATLCAEQKDFAAALKYQMRSQVLSNRTFTADKDKEIGRLQIRHKLVQQQKDLEYQRKTTQFYGIIGVLSFVLALIGIVFWSTRQRQRRKVLEQNNQLLEQNNQLLEQNNQLLEQDKLLLEKDKQFLEQNKQLIEAQETVNAQALVLAKQTLLLKNAALEQAKQDIVVKDAALQLSLAQLDLRNTLIEALQLQLTTTPAVKEGDAIPHMKILTAEDWVEFRRLFNARFPHFTEQLKSRFPTLTAGETRLFLLIKSGFDTNEIADVLGIASPSVYMSRKRLRKKLDLEQNIDLDGFVQGF